jgi:hypothetical protein
VRTGLPGMVATGGLRHNIRRTSEGVAEQPAVERMISPVAPPPPSRQEAEPLVAPRVDTTRPLTMDAFPSRGKGQA